MEEVCIQLFSLQLCIGLTSVWQLGQEKENSELKPEKLHLKFALLMRNGWVYIYILIIIKSLSALLKQSFLLKFQILFITHFVIS